MKESKKMLKGDSAVAGHEKKQHYLNETMTLIRGLITKNILKPNYGGPIEKV